MTATLPHMPYSYAHANTQATTGYFSCLPPANFTREDCLAWLCDHPNDSFMHRHLLRKFAQESLEQNINYIEKLQQDSPQARAIFAAIVYEITILDPKRLSLRDHIETLCPDCQGDMGDYLSAFTPLPYIAWSKQEQCELHQSWIDIFSNNIQKHHLLPHPEDDDLPLLYSYDSVKNGDTVNEKPCKSKILSEIHAEMLALAAMHPQDFPAWQRPPAQETADRALAVLQANNIIADIEMRHEASLSPIALLRRWNLSIHVEHNGASHSLCGETTTYGRGLSVADARASYLMEMVERASSYAHIGPHGLLNLAACDAFQQSHDLRPIFADGSRTYEQSLGADFSNRQEPLIHGRYSELVAQGHKVLNPLDIPSEAPYADQPLYWVTGYSPCHDDNAPTMTSYEAVLVPVQLIYLFNNLDEIDLSMAPSSTGLASGNTFAEAKLSALTEIIERDAEATSPYSRQLCFRAESHDPRLMGLLNDYAARGMHLHFQDMTSFTGVPCYTAFVMGARGVLASGTGAGLDGKRAALSAMTETPYPYPHGGPSAPALRGLESKKLEELPSFTLSSPEQNVMMLERLLEAKGLRPIYFNLTQSRFGLPVVKAIVRHMEPTAEFDQFSRVSKKLFANYLKIFA